MDKQTTKMINTCYKHKSQTTNLSCATCESSICIKCVIHTPTGIKCKNCANLKKIPTFEITPVYFIRGIISIMITLTLFTIGLYFLNSYIISGVFINLLAIIVLGFLIGQTLSFSVNYKRGKFLKLIAIISFITGIILIIVINKLLLINLFSIYGAASIIIGTYLSVDKF